jgi:hypothetical protein
MTPAARRARERLRLAEQAAARRARYDAVARQIRRAGGELELRAGGLWTAPGGLEVHPNTVRALARRLYLKPLEVRHYGRELVVRYGLAD